MIKRPENTRMYYLVFLKDGHWVLHSSVASRFYLDVVRNIFEKKMHLLGASETRIVTERQIRNHGEPGWNSDVKI